MRRDRIRFGNRTARIVRLADGDAIRANVFAKKTLRILCYDNDKLPKKTLLAIDPWE